MEERKKEREFGPDLVRVSAVILLFWLHYYLRCGFYYKEIKGAAGFIAVMFRPLFMCCVPLFATLTGYLKIGKEWKKGYYSSLVPILISFVLISFLHLLDKTFFRGEEFILNDRLLEFFNFKLANYSWYVGMYLGLYILSPLVNTLWNAKKEKGFHQAVLLSLILVSFLPATVNASFPVNVLPAYFTQLSYLTYYCMGGYIKTYRPQMSRRVLSAGIFFLALVQAVINLLTRTDAGNYYSGYNAGYGNAFIAAMTVLLFLLLYQVRAKSAGVKRTMALISGVVFEMYLVSWLIDTRVYPLFSGEYGFWLYPVIGLIMTGIVFLTSFILGSLIHDLSAFLSSRILKRFS